MKLCGLITEYNPFHNGHLYHLNEARRVSGAQAVVAVMSGHFLQRGEPAVMDKWTRAKLAVDAGVDLVIELPTYFSTSSAEGFALGAVALLNRLGVESLVFGSESGDVGALNNVAKLIDSPDAVYREILQESLDEGEGYHIARSKAIEASIGHHHTVDFKSNNILGIEYLRAINHLNSSIKPLTIKRIKNEYSEKAIHSDIASATAIRELLKQRPIDWDLLKTVVPQSTYNGLLAYGHYTSFDDFMVLFNAIALREGASGLKNIRDMSEGLENKILANLTHIGSLSDMAQSIKSKRYTLTRIQRIMLSSLLNIKPIEKEEALKSSDYARILAFNERGSQAIRDIKKNSDLVVLTNLARDLKKYRKSNALIDLDLLATGLYAQVNHSITMQSDYVTKPYSCMMYTKKDT
jgi:predicted nucleotidyltransferase